MVTVVFGARGNVGRHVAAGLRAAGIPIRATGRDPHAPGFPPDTPVVAADLDSPETLPAALEGAEKVFLYAKPDGIEGFVAAARSAGVRHVVLLSSASVVFPDAEHHPIAQLHRAVEVAIEGSGIDWTFIRPGMFATNTLWWWAQSIRTDSTVRTAYPDAQLSSIHEKDMAALAVTALTEPGHVQQAYTLYGPESLTIRQHVERIGEAIGRKVTLDVISVEEARSDLAKSMPAIGVDGIMRMLAASTDQPAATSTVVEEVTGRPARTFAEWAQDHADDFR